MIIEIQRLGLSKSVNLAKHHAIFTLQGLLVTAPEPSVSLPIVLMKFGHGLTNYNEGSSVYDIWLIALLICIRP
jgi:hypothetical protein